MRARPMAAGRRGLTSGLAACCLLLGACTGGGSSGAATPSPPAHSPTTPPTVPGGSASVRVNQVGYAVHETKRAYLMSSDPEAQATFAVVGSDGHAAYSAPIGADLGSWSSRYPFVYALDFDSVAAPGPYSIAVTGPVPASSPKFQVNTGQILYADALANALSFYQNERDGPNYVPSALRAAHAHLNDGHAMTYLTPKVNGDGIFRRDLKPLGVRLNAAGGWWDAGDYPKFLVTTGYTVDLLLAGVRDFPRQMGSGSARSNFTNEARFGTDWLMRMWDDSTSTLYYQVGIGSGNDHIAGDHDIWRMPQVDDTYGGTDPTYRYIRNRPVFRAAPPGSPVSPNLAGRDAAAFALCYQVFRQTDPAFAGRCLLAAEHIYALADPSPQGHLLTVMPWDFYPETEWRDDMELGATELYLALRSTATLPAGLPQTDPSVYLHDAASWAHAYLSGPSGTGDTLNLYDVSGLANFELYRAMERAGDPAGLETTPAELLAGMKRQLDKAVAQGRTDPFGFGFTWNNWDTTTHGAGMAVEASEYDQLTHSNAYAAWGRRQLANILGANAWGTSLIVGDGTTFPHCMQHQVTNIVGSLDGSSPILAGAAVEGPNSFAARGRLEHMRACPADGADTFAVFNGHGSVYQDNVQSYDTVEPAIDLTASSPLAFSRVALGLL